MTVLYGKKLVKCLRGWLNKQMCYVIRKLFCKAREFWFMLQHRWILRALYKEEWNNVWFYFIKCIKIVKFIESERKVKRVYSWFLGGGCFVLCCSNSFVPHEKLWRMMVVMIPKQCEHTVVENSKLLVYFAQLKI